ncbi:MAG: sigma-70 family RNA polymerase sigma factor [Bacteroidota bacterium]
MKTWSDEECINHLRSKNPLLQKEAYSWLRGKEMPKIRSYVINTGGNSDDAEDVFAYAITEVFRKYQPFGPIGAYLYRVAQLTWIKELKRRSKPLPPLEEGEEPSEMEETQSIIRHCLQQLSDKCQELLSLFYMDGMTYEDILLQQGEPSPSKEAISALKAKKYRCMQHFRKFMEPFKNRLRG